MPVVRLAILLAVAATAFAQDAEVELASDEEIEEAFADFKEAFRDPDPQARAAAVREFGYVPHRKTFQLLAQLTRHEDEAVVEAAFAGLFEQPFEKPVRDHVLAEFDHFHRKRMSAHLRAAAAALGRVPEPRSVKALLAVLHYPDHDVVKAALRSIADIRDKGVLAKMIVFLETVFPNRDERNLHPPGFNWERYEALEADIRSTMKALTGKSHEFEEDWRRWYNENRKDYPSRY